MYKPLDDFTHMSIKTFSWGIIGLILGVIVNNTIIYLYNTLNIDILLVQNILQVLLCSIVLSLLNKYYHFFGWSWQNATEGLFFVSFFFGVQFNLFSNIQNTYIIDNNIVNSTKNTLPNTTLNTNTASNSVSNTISNTKK